MQLPARQHERPDPRVRAARLSDLEELLGLEEACFDADRISRRSLKRLLTSPSATCLVATRNDEILGYAMILRRTGTSVARLYSIAVAAGARGLGLGRRLLDAAETVARERGYALLRLEVREDNGRAAALYRHAGYRPIGRYPDYYADHAGALRFEKRLGARDGSAMKGSEAGAGEGTP